MVLRDLKVQSWIQYHGYKEIAPWDLTISHFTTLKGRKYNHHRFQMNHEQYRVVLWF